LAPHAGRSLSIVPPMQRPLGNMEAALQVTGTFAPMSVAGIVQLRNPPNHERIRDALDVVQRRHPLLRARVVTRNRRLFFDVSSDVPPIPLEVLPRRHDTQWQDVATEVINENLDVETGPLVSCTYLIDEDAAGADLVFAYDHSVMDATSAGHVYAQILGLCGGVADPEEFAPLPLSPSIDQLLPERLTGATRLPPLGRFMGRQAADEFSYMRGIHGRATAIQPAARCRILTRTLDTDDTGNLVGSARSRRLTTNSVVAAGLLIATHEQLYAQESLPMRCITFANLRPQLQPAPSADALGCYLSMLRHTIQVGPNDDLWSVAHAVQAQVRNSMALDEHLLAASMAKQVMKFTIATKRTRMATTAVSYAGPLALAARFGDIEVTNIHGFISNNRLGPVATAFASIFANRLTWDFVFLDTDMDHATADHVADSTIDTLRTAARG
jgi:hypothetical protein